MTFKERIPQQHPLPKASSSGWSLDSSHADGATTLHLYIAPKDAPAVNQKIRQAGSLEDALRVVLEECIRLAGEKDE